MQKQYPEGTRLKYNKIRTNQEKEEDTKAERMELSMREKKNGSDEVGKAREIGRKRGH